MSLLRDLSLDPHKEASPARPRPMLSWLVTEQSWLLLPEMAREHAPTHGQEKKKGGVADGARTEAPV